MAPTRAMPWRSMPGACPALRGATADYSWLLSRGYATVSTLKLVGDRWNLTERQRMAVRRSACSDQPAPRRLERSCCEIDLAGCILLIDGFNVLTTIEAALGGAVVLSCRDETYRDIAGLHGTYRRVEETMPVDLASGRHDLQPGHPPMPLALRPPGVK